MSAANDEDQLISVTRAGIAKFTYMLDGIRKLKSGNTSKLLVEGGATSLFGHQLRSLLRDYNRHASKTRQELSTRSLDRLSDLQREAVMELSRLLAQIEAECQSAELHDEMSS